MNTEINIDNAVSMVYAEGEWVPINKCDFIEFCDGVDAGLVKFEYNEKKYKSLIKTIFS